MDTLIEIGKALIDFVVGIAGSCSGTTFRQAKGKKKNRK